MKTKFLLSVALAFFTFTYGYSQEALDYGVDPGSGTIVDMSVIHQWNQKVGIHITTPDSKLHVKDYVSTSADNAAKNKAVLKLEKNYYNPIPDPNALYGSGSSTLKFAVNCDNYAEYDAIAEITAHRDLALSHIDGRNYRYLHFNIVDCASSQLSTVMTISCNKNVGIGITKPDSKLHVSAGTTTSMAKFVNNNANVDIIGSSSQVGFRNTTNKPLLINTNNNSNQLFLATNGSIGIGTNATHNYKLAVAGTIITEGIYVKLQSNWPDYVFSENYKLKPLCEVEAFIKENNHLPDVPSALEVKENGIDLGEMNSVLLQKIEELTLYIIELEKKVNAIENKN